MNSICAIRAALQVSQEAAEQFQIATASFNPSIGMTTTGAVDIVTRSGGNRFQGDAFVFYRDHHLSAYPSLRRDPTNPDPYFERRQAGGAAGGPLARDRVFFFATYERSGQDSVVAVQPGTPAFAPLGGLFPSPLTGNQWTGRLDVAVSPRQQVFARYSFDGNDAFAPIGQAPGVLPSAWSRTSNRAHQIVAGSTRVLPSALVNDLRVSAFFLDSAEHPADARACPGCVGVGAPQLVIPDAGLTLGQSRTLEFEARRMQISNHLSWSHMAHHFTAGLDWEHGRSRASSVTLDPAQLTLWAPARVQAFDSTIPLPASFTTLDDLLQLPLQAFQTAVGPGGVPQQGFQPDRVLNMYRLFAGDSWHAGPKLSVDAGLSASYETGALNDDLTKPSLLGPIVGQAGLRAATGGWRMAPRAGFAWTRSGPPHAPSFAAASATTSMPSKAPTRSS